MKAKYMYVRLRLLNDHGNKGDDSCTPKQLSVHYFHYRHTLRSQSNYRDHAVPLAGKAIWC